MARTPFYPVGAYTGRVVRQSLGVSKNDKPQFTLTCQIIEGVDQFGSVYPVEQSYERTIYIYFSDSPKGMEIVLKQLAVLGFDKTSLKFLSPDTPGFVDFTGQDVPLYCKHEEYEGEEREKWSISTPRDTPATKPVDSSAIRKLDALYGKGLKEIAAGKKPSEPVKQPAGVRDGFEVPPGDDIPF